MAGQCELRAWLIQKVGISAERIGALLQVLDKEEVDTVNDLQILGNTPRFDELIKLVTAKKIRDALASSCDTDSAPPITPSAAELQPPAADGNPPGRAREALPDAGALALVSPQNPPPSASPDELAAAPSVMRAASTPPIAVNKAKRSRPTHVACFGCQLQHPSTPTDQLTQLPAPSKGPFIPADRICERCHTNELRIPRSHVHGVKFLTELYNRGGTFKTEPWFCLKDYGTSPPLAYTNSCCTTKLDSAAEQRCSVIILKNEDDWQDVLKATMDSGKVVRRIADETLVEIPEEWFDDEFLCFVWSSHAEQFILGKSATRKRKADALTGQSAEQLLVPPPSADTPAPPAQLADASAAASAAPAEGCPDLDDSGSDYEKDKSRWLAEHGTLGEWLDYLEADEANRAIILNNGAAGASGAGASGGGASGGGSGGGGSSGGDGAPYRSLGGAEEGEGPPQITNRSAGDDAPPRFTSCRAGADEGEHRPVMRSLGSEDQGQGPTAFTPLGGAGEAEEAEEGEEISELLEQAREHLRYGALRAAKAVLRRVKALKGHARRA